MSYTIEDWKKRIQSRSDITRMVTHLTKPDKDINLNDLSFEDINIKAVDNLIKILQDKVLLGSLHEGYIAGSTPAVCFQDAPLTGLIQNILHEKERREKNKYEKLRYCGVGLSFLKQFIFFKNGRPVIYDNNRNKLPLSDHWKVVNFDLSNNNAIVDWTHEREWRVPKDLAFEYENVHIILYNVKCYKYFIKNCPKPIIDSIGGITTLEIVAL